MRSAIALTVTLAVASLVVVGCSKSSLAPEVEDGPQYSELTSPENVLANLVEAYEHEDLESYMALFADDFVFYTAEQNQDPSHEDPLPVYWSKACEETLHEAMFSSPMLTDISLELATITSDSVPAPDGRGGFWHWYYEDVDLRLKAVDGSSYIATLPSLFYLRRIEGQTDDDGHPLWEIFEWRDNPYDVTPSPGDSRYEESTWGGLKAMFR
jgi:hypothetical protein